MTTVVRDDTNTVKLTTFFDSERFDMVLETLGEFEVAEAVSNSTRGLVRYSLAAGGWHVYDEGIWRLVDRADMLWAISGLMVEAGNEGEAIERQDMRKYDKKLPANRHILKMSKKVVHFYARMRKRASDLRYMERLLMLMEMSTIFRIQVTEIERHAPPEELRYR